MKKYFNKILITHMGNKLTVEWLNSLKVERLLSRIGSCTTLFCYTNNNSLSLKGRGISIRHSQGFALGIQRNCHAEFISASINAFISALTGKMDRFRTKFGMTHK